MKKHPTFRRDYLKIFMPVLGLAGVLLLTTAVTVFFELQSIAKFTFIAFFVLMFFGVFFVIARTHVLLKCPSCGGRLKPKMNTTHASCERCGGECDLDVDIWD